MKKIAPQKSYEERRIAIDWDSLNFTNAYLFATVMKNKQICKGVLERLLGHTVSDFSYLEVEKTMDQGLLSKSVRLDVYVESEADVAYNIEMQGQDTGELEKRIRYNRSMIDMETLEKGRSYRNLGESYVIFICKEDVFKRGQRRYTFRNTCEEVADLKLEDGTYILFFNTKGTKGKISKELQALFDYIEDGATDDLFIRQLDKEVQKVKNSAKWRSDYMRHRDAKIDYIEKGRAEGKELGKVEATMELAKRFLALGNTVDDVARASNLPLDVVQSLVS